MGGAKVESLGGIGFFRPLLEPPTTLDEYKIVGPNAGDASCGLAEGERQNSFGLQIAPTHEQLYQLAISRALSQAKRSLHLPQKVIYYDLYDYSQSGP